MKTLLAFLSCIVVTSAAAQESHTMSDHVSHGGFGGPMFRFSELNGQLAVLAGGHGGWVIDRRFVLGGGGYGLIGDGIDVPYAPSPGVRAHLTFGYGGLEMAYVDHPSNQVHLVVFGLVGGGDASFRAGTARQSDGVFVLEPGISFTVHGTRAIHFNLGATYRFVGSVELPGLSDTSLSGFAAHVGVDFGHF